MYGAGAATVAIGGAWLFLLNYVAQYAIKHPTDIQILITVATLAVVGGVVVAVTPTVVYSVLSELPDLEREEYNIIDDEGPI